MKHNEINILNTNIIYRIVNQSNKKEDKAGNTADVPSSSNTEVPSSNPPNTNINSTNLSNPNYHPNNDETNGNMKNNNDIPNANPSSFLPGALQPNTLTNQFQKVNQPLQCANKNSFTLKVLQLCDKNFVLFLL